MDISKVMNDFGLLIACSFMVLMVLLQSVVFFVKSWKNAPNVGLTKEQCFRGMRSALISSIGPSLSPVIILMSLIVVVGAPTAWMRLNDIGAARTELAMANMAAGVVGGDLSNVANVTAETFGAVISGMALNNMGWMLVALIVTPQMTKVLHVMNNKLDPNWVKKLMVGGMLGIFAYSAGNQIVGKASPYLIAVIASACSMVGINMVFKNNLRLQEVSLGISMIIGMTVATIAKSMIG